MLLDSDWLVCFVLDSGWLFCFLSVLAGQAVQMFDRGNSMVLFAVVDSPEWPQNFRRLVAPLPVDYAVCEAIRGLVSIGNLINATLVGYV